MTLKFENDNDNDDSVKVKNMFIEAGIPPRLHFTKLGYFKLYREMKYWYSHYTQLAAFFSFCFSIYYLALFISSKSFSYQLNIFICLAVAASLQCISEFLVGDFRSAFRMLVGAAIVFYILINFI